MAFGQAAAMRFRVLGPLEVWSGEGWVGISAEKCRALLACLVLNAGQIVPTETLIIEAWADTPPPTANNLVSIYVNQFGGPLVTPTAAPSSAASPATSSRWARTTRTCSGSNLMAGGRDARGRERRAMRPPPCWPRPKACGGAAFSLTSR